MLFDAVILAGGRSNRLGGHPKSELVFEGSTLLERTLGAVRDARQVVIVGDPGATAVPPSAIVTRESPAFGGPAAAIAAGLAAATGDAARWVLVLACDMPNVAAAVPVLLGGPTDDAGCDAVLARDEGGPAQYLLARYRRAALEAAISGLGGEVSGTSVRSLVSSLEITLVGVAVGASTDIDTWDDAAGFGIPPTEGAPHG